MNRSITQSLQFIFPNVWNEWAESFAEDYERGAVIRNNPQEIESGLQWCRDNGETWHRFYHLMQLQDFCHNPDKYNEEDVLLQAHAAIRNLLEGIKNPSEPIVQTYAEAGFRSIKAMEYELGKNPEISFDASQYLERQYNLIRKQLADEIVAKLHYCFLANNTLTPGLLCTKEHFVLSNGVRLLRVTGNGEIDTSPAQATTQIGADGVFITETTRQRLEECAIDDLIRLLKTAETLAAKRYTKPVEFKDLKKKFPIEDRTARWRNWNAERTEYYIR